MRVLAEVALIGLCLSGCGGGTTDDDQARGRTTLSDGGHPDAADCWRTFEVPTAFEFDAPCSMTGGPLQGVDSLVGNYSADGIVMYYDYGSFSSPLTEWNGHDEYARKATVVDGRAAEIVTARDPADALGFLAGLVIPQARGESVRLTLYANASDATRRDLVVRIFETVTFP